MSKIVLYVCAIDTVLIIVSDNSVKNGSLIYCFMCVLWPVIERWDLSKILNWIDWITKFVEETKIACDGHVCQWIETKWAIFIENLPLMIPTKFQFIWESDIRGEYFFRNQPIKNKNGLWRPCLLTDRN
jgi:hypothetical protein